MRRRHVWIAFWSHDDYSQGDQFIGAYTSKAKAKRAVKEKASGNTTDSPKFIWDGDDKNPDEWKTFMLFADVGEEGDTYHYTIIATRPK